MFSRFLRFFFGPKDRQASAGDTEDATETEPERSSTTSPSPDSGPEGESECLRARLAIYDNYRSSPRIVKVSGEGTTEFIERLSDKTYEALQRKDSDIPFSTVHEIIENLIHADFREVVISILPEGNTVRVSDLGPGIPDRHKAVQPGFSTATENMKRYIRGVGSGLPIARETINFVGGRMHVDDNMDRGTVITLSTGEKINGGMKRKGERPGPEPGASGGPSTRGEGGGSVDSVNLAPTTSPADSPQKGPEIEKGGDSFEIPEDNFLGPEQAGKNDLEKEVSIEALKDNFSKRQKKVLLLLAEIESIGPSRVASELDISLSTAYRDLKLLEEHDLVRSNENGKRNLTERGLKFLSRLFEES